MSSFWDHDPQTGEIRGGTKPNIAEYSVTEISHALKRTLEDAFGHVRVRGEISGFRGPQSSGHCYFCIKDEGAKLEAVVWRSGFARVKANLREGLEVVATGKITGYSHKSAYQIVIESLEPAGAGALMVLLEERKKKLAAEGLFDQARKKPLPFLPKLIGIVTSPTGAVIRDILHRLKDRFPRHVTVWPVRVQGETSAGEVAVAIAGLNNMTPRPDLIIVARGGGSLEDLWAFNDEMVVRAVVASAIPLISAVGHETDTTLIDFAADWRAPTPTAAAERAVPVRVDLLAQLASYAARHERCWRRGMEERATRVRAAVRALPRPEEILALARQRHDTAAGRLAQALRANTHQHRARFQEMASRLTVRPVNDSIRNDRRRLMELGQRSARSLLRIADFKKQRLESVVKLMTSLSYKSVLQRGFALVRDAGGLPVRSALAVKPAQELAVEFADGSVKVREDSGPKQGSLL